MESITNGLRQTTTADVCDDGGWLQMASTHSESNAGACGVVKTGKVAGQLPTQG